MLRIINHENGVIINGDEAVLEKAQQGNGNIPAELTSIEGLRVNSDTLVVLYDKAERTGPIIENVDGEDVVAGYPIAKQYAALKQAFIQQQELAKAKHEPVVEE